MISFAEVEIGSGGLPTCASCGASAAFEPRPSATITAQLGRIAQEWSAGPGPNVSFGGGESLAHPELPPLILAARSAGFERVRLVTSAAALCAHGNAAGALDAGVRHLEVVMLGATVDHDRLVGRPGEFAALAAGVAAFRAAATASGAKIAIAGRVPVCRHNLELLGPAMAEAGRLGMVAATLEVSEAAAASLRASTWLEAALDSAVTNGVWATVVGAERLALPSLHRVAVETVTS